MSAPGPVPLKELDGLTPEEERAWQEQVRRRNRIWAVALGVFVALVMAITIFGLLKHGFIRLDDADLFRSN